MHLAVARFHNGNCPHVVAVYHHGGTPSAWPPQGAGALEGGYSSPGAGALPVRESETTPVAAMTKMLGLPPHRGNDQRHPSICDEPLSRGEGLHHGHSMPPGKWPTTGGRSGRLH